MTRTAMIREFRAAIGHLTENERSGMMSNYRRKIDSENEWCALCEGKGITGRIVDGKIVDQKCGWCKGTGRKT